MHKPYDITMKTIMEQNPVAWLKRFGIDPDGPVVVVDSEVSTVKSDVDKLFLIDGADPYLAHIELQSGPDPEMPWRMNQYNFLVGRDDKIPVLSVLVLLRRSADADYLTGNYTRKVKNFGIVSTFRYPINRVWEFEAESILEGDLAILPIASLANIPDEEVPAVLERVDERITRETKPSTASTIMTASLLLAGMRIDQDQIEQLKGRLSSMNVLRESSFYQMIVEEGKSAGLAEGRKQGIKEGIEEGIKEGRLEEARKLLLEVGKVKFGPPNASIRKSIKAIDDLERIHRSIRRILKATDWKDLLGQP
jgi:predicted transposase YdaD